MFNDSIIPTVRERKGNASAWLLINAASSEIVTGAFWESDEEMMAEEPPSDVTPIYVVQFNAIIVM